MHFYFKEHADVWGWTGVWFLTHSLAVEFPDAFPSSSLPASLHLQLLQQGTVGSRDTVPEMLLGVALPSLLSIFLGQRLSLNDTLSPTLWVVWPIQLSWAAFCHFCLWNNVTVWHLEFQGGLLVLLRSVCRKSCWKCCTGSQDRKQSVSRPLTDFFVLYQSLYCLQGFCIVCCSYTEKCRKSSTSSHQLPYFFILVRIYHISQRFGPLRVSIRFLQN